ncbi:MAG: erythromycin esterase family protein [Planctomycetes bacterium]|nr:erythromycin esterase family protein [Planctomycetota bacterium]
MTLSPTVLAFAVVSYVCAPQAPPAAEAAGDAEVVAWLKAARENAPSIAEFVAPKDDSKAARVVVVGRAYSGTNELAAFERRVVEALPRLDVVALDIGWSEGDALDQWVRTGEGDLASIISHSGTFGWSAIEARALIEGLRKRDPRPQVAGIATGDPKSACATVLEYLGRVYPESSARAEILLRPLRTDTPKGEPRYHQLDDSQRGILRLGVEEIVNVIRDQVETMTRKSSVTEYARALSAATALLQYEDVMRFEREGGESDPHGRILAENTVRVLSALPATARLVALVNVRDLARASDRDSFVAQLEQSLAQPVLCVATACGRGEFLAVDPNNTAAGPRLPREVKLDQADCTKLEGALHSGAGLDGRLLLAGSRPTTGIAEWLSKNGTLRSARAVCGGASETKWSFDVLGDFDAIAVIWDVHAARTESGTAR